MQPATPAVHGVPPPPSQQPPPQQPPQSGGALAAGAAPAQVLLPQGAGGPAPQGTEASRKPTPNLNPAIFDECELHRTDLESLALFRALRVVFPRAQALRLESIACSLRLLLLFHATAWRGRGERIELCDGIEEAVVVGSNETAAQIVINGALVVRYSLTPMQLLR